MNDLATKSYVLFSATSDSVQDRIKLASMAENRRDRWVTVVIIAIALVVAVGLVTAWWITCQNEGMYPALDMPSWNSGGTWKAYCTS
jgi:hypothetical protein